MKRLLLVVLMLSVLYAHPVVDETGACDEEKRRTDATMFGLGPAAEGIVLDACHIAPLISHEYLANEPSDDEIHAALGIGPWMATKDTDIRKRAIEVIARLGYQRYDDAVLEDGCYELLAPIIGMPPSITCDLHSGEPHPREHLIDSAYEVFKIGFIQFADVGDEAIDEIRVSIERMQRVVGIATHVLPDTIVSPSTAQVWRAHEALYIYLLVLRDKGDLTLSRELFGREVHRILMWSDEQTCDVDSTTQQ